MHPIAITYYSDVLCIWAYVSQARLDAAKRTFGGSLSIDYRFVSVFGDAQAKLEAAWKDRGAFEGYAKHVRSIADRFPPVKLHPDAWAKVRPRSSMSPHLFLKAVAVWERARAPQGASSILESTTASFRRGFFEEARDIGSWEEQCDLARPFGVDISAIESLIHDGTAFAALSRDYLNADKDRIEGSPTFLLNEGRQKLYGNVGFRVIEANIKELLRTPDLDEASWC